MVKQKLLTISITMILLLSTATVWFLAEHRAIIESPELIVTMLVSTAIYVFVGCLLQTFGHIMKSLALGVVVFFILCTCLFYSTTVLEFIAFFVCMAFVIRKSTVICNSIGDCRNPLI